MAAIAELRLNNEPEAAGLARAFVVREIGTEPFSAPELADEAELLVSELVTNVVRHTDTCVMVVTLARLIDCIRLAVRDDSTQRPVERAAADSDESGRGLLLLNSLATSWGVDPEDAGKTVWTLLELG